MPEMRQLEVWIMMAMPKVKPTPGPTVAETRNLREDMIVEFKRINNSISRCMYYYYYYFYLCTYHRCVLVMLGC